ncbi:unnamed protein product [Didymodactylos carnosus]|uniref:Uncharacterized protein n=1 Tax=Didymodactylos carnosus TaxID=1234261 RepID=A0A814YR11_9BILA|nr:unnamed protein product [Didymodactylos carnosus]CAF1234423.1 unnamed protein product [Didymodactylos carnosus]CAF3790110.1 unnamed protein product [Didymodactylos carnosus]CAF3996976.1 unnamed protein product [Didymodactylos carnosus]
MMNNSIFLIFLVFHVFVQTEQGPLKQKALLQRNARTANDTTEAPSNPCSLSDEQINQSYNLTLHIISIFVILVVSCLGASFSVVTTRISCLHVSPIIINVGKFFGTGVILATGFIHMLPDANEALTDPCLPDSWNIYGAYAGLFAMLAALVMQLTEFIAHSRYRRLEKKKQKECKKNNIAPISHTHNHDDVKEYVNSEKKDCPEEQYQQQSGTSTEITVAADETEIESAHSHGVVLQEMQQHKISTYLLEIGIAMHSVLIGIALGTTSGSSFVALFIALVFHQFFEGVALGAQIAKLEQKSIIPAVIMVVFFALTTAVGIAIGVGIHQGTYNPKSVASLLVNGIFDSISAGILIYVALVNLITAEFSNSQTFYALRIRLKVLYYASLYLGASCMAIVGRWA